MAWHNGYHSCIAHEIMTGQEVLMIMKLWNDEFWELMGYHWPLVFNYQMMWSVMMWWWAVLSFLIHDLFQSMMLLFYLPPQPRLLNVSGSLMMVLVSIMIHDGQWLSLSQLSVSDPCQKMRQIVSSLVSQWVFPLSGRKPMLSDWRNWDGLGTFEPSSST